MDSARTNSAMRRLVEGTPARSVHFSCATGEWETPHVLFDELDRIYGGFTLDPCASAESAKCPRFFTRSDDGLSQPWSGKVFMNPPYGRQIGEWVKKAWEESQKGVLVVCLLPARVDTRWWHDYARKGYVYFLQGRLKFGVARNSAPFPSAVVTFGRFFNR
jgi:phage N-6-adenine-methyltransferase